MFVTAQKNQLFIGKGPILVSLSSEPTIPLLCEVVGFHRNKNVHCGLVGCDAV